MPSSVQEQTDQFSDVMGTARGSDRPDTPEPEFEPPFTLGLFELDRAALDRTLDELVAEGEYETLAGISVDSLSESGSDAVAKLMNQAAQEWQCIRTPADDIELSVYPIENEYENLVMVSAAYYFPGSGDRLQLSPGVVDANKLTADMWGASGPDHIAEVIEAVLVAANAVVPQMEKLLRAQ